MATTKTTTTKKTTAKKSTATKKTTTRAKSTTTKKSAEKEETTVSIDKKKFDDMLNLMSAMQEKINDLETKVKDNENNRNQVVSQPFDKSLRRVKCINTINSILCVSTQPDGKGRNYVFDKFGDTKLIRLDDVTDICASCPDIIQKGMMYICDREIVEMLSLEDLYDSFCTDIEMNKLSELKDETCVDKMLSLNENVRKEILSKIVSNIAKGKAYDLNLISKLNNELNININEMAEDYKATYVDSGIDK